MRDNARQRQATLDSSPARRHPLKISSKLAEAGLAVASCRTTRVASPCSLSRSLRARALLLARRSSKVGAAGETAAYLIPRVQAGRRDTGAGRAGDDRRLDPPGTLAARGVAAWERIERGRGDTALRGLVRTGGHLQRPDRPA